MKKLYDAADRVENLEKALKEDIKRIDHVMKRAEIISWIALVVAVIAAIPVFREAIHYFNSVGLSH